MVVAELLELRLQLASLLFGHGRELEGLALLLLLLGPLLLRLLLLLLGLLLLLLLLGPFRLLLLLLLGLL